MIYKTKDGDIRMNKIDDKAHAPAFKVNLPLTEEDYESGNGEGVWCFCSKEDMVKVDSNVKSEILVKILNDSLYYPNLKYGMLVLCKYDGVKRPVAIKSELDHHYGDCITIEEKEEILRKVYARLRTRI